MERQRKTYAISIRLPDSLHRKVKEVAIYQMITLAVAEKLSAFNTEDYLGTRAKGASKAKFQRALRKIAAKKPERKDRM